MGIMDRATDWKVASLAQVGGSDVVVGGVYWFEFRSSKANICETFMFIGGGIGVGGSVGGGSLTPDSAAPIECDREFSVADLNMSAGRLTLAAGSLGAGYGLLYISAFNSRGSLFSSQDVGGLGGGVGLSAQTLVGYWRSMALAARDIQEGVEGNRRRYTVKQ